MPWNPDVLTEGDAETGVFGVELLLLRKPGSLPEQPSF